MQDTVKNWVAECLTEQDRAPRPASSALFSVWKQWAEANGEYVGSAKALSQKLLDLGFRSHHTKEGTVFRGLKVK